MICTFVLLGLVLGLVPTIFEVNPLFKKLGISAVVFCLWKHDPRPHLSPHPSLES